MRSVLAPALLASVLAAGSARAQQACADPQNLPNPVYLTIGDTQVNLIKALGKQLRDTENTTLIWVATGSCTNLDTLYKGTRLTGNLSYIPASYDPKAMPTPPTCSVPMPGVNADIANSIVFLDGCPSTRPATVADALGPVQSFVFVVPTASPAVAITAEEAYFVFGFGMAGMVTPWIDDKQLYIRPTTKGTIISMGASIKVPAGKWKGVPVNLSPDLASMVAGSSAPTSAIGILGSEVYDGLRQNLKALAFRAFGQYHAFFPDSKPTAFDRQNVRDGHYHMWSYTHWLITTDAMGNPVNPRAKRVVDLIVSTPVAPPPKFEPIDVIARVGLVPSCAMKVQRSVEGGPYLPFDPPAPCGCYFDQLTGTTGCTPCSDSTPCNRGTCRRGFCEAH